MKNYFVEVPVIKVEQPLSTFYCASLKVRDLLAISFSDKMAAIINEDNGSFELQFQGTQRELSEKRLKEISNYINRVDTSFPNSIILAANFTEDGHIVDAYSDEYDNSYIKYEDRWKITEKDGHLYLQIPTAKKLAAIIDGQHRLFAFAKADNSRLDMELLCSIYLDLPKAYQAQIFATINSNQKPVDKSLTYQLFGYNISNEESENWSPDKLAVFLSRNLHLDQESPFYSKIKISQLVSQEDSLSNSDWKVSTAVIVEGILRLITSNPKQDADLMRISHNEVRTNLINKRKDNSPLRDLYIQSKDGLIYSVLINYFKACKFLFWDKASEKSYITKTVGIQALFDVLRFLSFEAYKQKDFRVENFIKHLEKASFINFEDDIYTNASGSGRTRIKNAIMDAIKE
ncbi:DNA phosphorothioation-associated DGQHR protein 1 [Acinetobacter soli]|uniref:DNA phosphorothioation-associated DGQHR protein 1 n=1 Tax=Acinetobacter soli TaxID=487316 RepID=UPI003017AC8B